MAYDDDITRLYKACRATSDKDERNDLVKAMKPHVSRFMNQIILMGPIAGMESVSISRTSTAMN